MQSHQYFLTAAATSLLLGGIAQSQDVQTTGQERSPQATPKDAPFRVDQWVDMDDYIGADVKLEASTEEKIEAAEDGERPEGETGELSDILFDRNDGSLEWAVVSCGGWLGMGEKSVLMSVDSLTWNPKEECFYLGLSEEQLKALPSFDLEKARERGLDETITAYDAAWKQKGLGRKPIDASSPQQPGKDMPSEPRGNVQVGVRTYGDKRFSPVTWGFLSASEIDGVDVYAQDSDFADIDTFIIDRDANMIAFLVLSHGGVGDVGDTKYIVPFDALAICHLGDADDEDPKTVFCSSKAENELEQCVKYEAPDEGALSKETLAQIRSHQSSSDKLDDGRQPGTGDGGK